MADSRMGLSISSTGCHDNHYRHAVIALTTCSDFHRRDHRAGRAVPVDGQATRSGPGSVFPALARVTTTAVRTSCTPAIPGLLTARSWHCLRAYASAFTGTTAGTSATWRERISGSRYCEDQRSIHHCLCVGFRDITRWFTSVRRRAVSRVFEIYNGVDVSKFRRPGRIARHGSWGDTTRRVRRWYGRPTRGSQGPEVIDQRRSRNCSGGSPVTREKQSWSS